MAPISLIFPINDYQKAISICSRFYLVMEINMIKYTPRQKFSIFQLHSIFVTNPADKLQNIKQRYNLWIWKNSIL